jgi:branched-chain amino acid transport system substrate-binding protein
MLKTKKMYVAIFIVVLAIATAGSYWYYTSLKKEEVEYIKIGYIGPFTGAAADYGTNGWRGVEIALEEINGPKGIVLSTEEKVAMLGAPEGLRVGGKVYKIQVIRYDDMGKPEEGVACFMRGVLQDKVCAFIGPHMSSVAFALLPLLERYKIPMVSIEAAATNLTTQGNQWFFRYTTPPVYIAYKVGEQVVDVFKPKTAAGLCVNTDYGRSFMKAYLGRLKDLGVNVTSENLYELGTTDFTPFLAKIKAEAPDVLLCAGSTSEAVMIAKQAKEIGLTEKTLLFGSGEWGTEEFGVLAGEASEGVTAVCPIGENTNVTLYERLKKIVKERYNAPMHYAIYRAYDKLWIVVQAIRYADSFDPIKINEMLNTKEFKSICDDHLTFPDQSWNGYNFTNQYLMSYKIIWFHNTEINYNIHEHPRAKK